MDSNSKSFDRSVSNPVKVYGAAQNGGNEQPRSSFKGYIDAEANEYNGISNIKKKVNKSDFLERFQGRQSLMNKEGHLGIVKDTRQPIKKVDKVELNASLLKSTQKQSMQQAADQQMKSLSYTPLAASSNRQNT